MPFEARRAQAARPLCIAHRGASAHAAENTLAAFRAAAQLGADMWELDVQLSADGVAVVSHDDALARRYGIDGAISSMSAAALRAAAPGLPRFEEVVALAEELGQGLYVELKAPGAGRAAIEVLGRRGFDAAILGSFDPAEVARTASESRRWKLSVLVRLGDDPFARAAEAGADMIHLCWERGGDRPQDLVTPDLLDTARSRGLDVVLWHEERPDILADLLRLPVLGICTDQPELIGGFAGREATGIEVVCHRGINHLAPENTMAAARLTYDMGCDWLELDVRLSADGEIVVIHDPTLERTTNGAGPVGDHDLAALKALDAGLWFSPHYTGERLPTLREAIALCRARGRRMYIENKSVPVDRLLPLVEEMDFLEDCFFWSGNPKLQSDMRAASPRARIKANIIHHGGSFDAMVEALRPDICEIQPADWPREAPLCRRAGIVPMLQYFGDDPAVFDDIAALRPEMVNLDRADLLLAAIRRAE